MDEDKEDDNKENEKEGLLRELGGPIINRIANKHSIKPGNTEERLLRLLAMLSHTNVKQEYENYIDCRLKAHFLYLLRPDHLGLAKNDFTKFLESHNLTDYLYSSSKNPPKTKTPQLVFIKQMEDSWFKLYYTYLDESSEWDYIKNKPIVSKYPCLAIALIEPETGLLSIRVPGMDHRNSADVIFKKLKRGFSKGNGIELKFDQNHLLNLFGWSEQRRIATVLPVFDDAEEQEIINDKKYRAKRGKDFYESEKLKKEIESSLKGGIHVLKTFEKSKVGFNTSTGPARLSFRTNIGERAIKYVLNYIKEILGIS